MIHLPRVLRGGRVPVPAGPAAMARRPAPPPITPILPKLIMLVRL